MVITHFFRTVPIIVQKVEKKELEGKEEGAKLDTAGFAPFMRMLKMVKLVLEEIELLYHIGKLTIAILSCLYPFIAVFLLYDIIYR